MHSRGSASRLDHPQARRARQRSARPIGALLLAFLSICLGVGPAIHQIADAWRTVPDTCPFSEGCADERSAPPSAHTDDTHDAIHPCAVCAWARSLTLALDARPSGRLETPVIFADPSGAPCVLARAADPIGRPRAPPSLI
ncbi:MAG: hypothetical protein D6693_01925 [Planctomycetota bacterium]|nr:MAG: hypothetical protein D6693_01925 [Planctomycetota bacterium]